MNAFSSAPNEDEKILVEFVRDWEEHGSVIIDDYLGRYPHLAEKIRDFVRMQQQIDGSRPDLDPGIPPQLGEFRIVRPLAHGGMGEIYEAVQERLHRRVAVKIIRRGRISPEARARFLREQMVLARLHQTHIVPIHTAGEEGPLQYFAMPYIEGAALHHVIRTAWQLETSEPRSQTPPLAQLAGMLATPDKDGGKAPSPDAGPNVHAANTDVVRSDGLGTLPAAEAAAARTVKLALSLDYFRSVAQVMADAAEALHHAHEVQILHRDVKPSNIMVDKLGQCWIIDFGLAGYVEAPDQAEALSADTATRLEPATSSALIGTPHYMAPEQFLGKADVRTDVWGLGVTLYELLTLRRAFPESRDPALRGNPVLEEPPLPRELVGNVPLDLVAICRKAMQTEPGWRYPSARAFAEDLRRWLRSEPTIARPARTPRRVFLWSRRNKGWASAITITLLASIALAVALVALANTERLAAEANAQASREREAAAEANAAAAQELARTRQRESLLYQLQRLRSTPHTDGWSREAWNLVEQAAKIRIDDDLKNEGAATLIGIDARIAKRFPQLVVSSAAWDRAGKRLLLGGLDKEGAKLWDSETDQLQISQQAGPGPVVFRADGTPLQIVAKDRGSLLLWDMAQQQRVQEFQVPEKGEFDPWLVAVTTDGSFVAAAVSLPNEKGVVVVWDTLSGKPLHQFPERATALAFSPDGTRLATGNADGQIAIWTLPKGERLATLAAGHTRIQCLAFSRDRWRRGAREPAESDWLLAAGDVGGTVVIWDLHTTLPRTYCHGSNHDVKVVVFSPDGVTLASSGRSEAKLWDLATGRLLLNCRHQNTTTALAFSPDGKRLAVNSLPLFGYPAAVVVWELEEGRGIQTLRGLNGQISKYTISPDGRLLAALSHGWQLAIWDLATGHLRHVLEAHKGWTADNAALAISADGRRFAFATARDAKLWDLATGQELRSWPLPPGLGEVLAFHTSGKLLLFRVETPSGQWGEDQPRVCRIRDLLGLAPSKPIAEITVFNRRVFKTVAPPDGAYFAVEGIQKGPNGESRSLKAFDGLTGNELWSLRLTPTFESADPSLDPSGKFLTLHATKLPVVTLLEMPSGKLLRTADGYLQGLGPEARYWIRHPPIESSSPPYGFRLFRFGDMTPLVTLGIDVPTAKAQFNAAGSHLAWGNLDGTVTVCDLRAIQRRLAQVGLGW